MTTPIRHILLCNSLVITLAAAGARAQNTADVQRRREALERAEAAVRAGDHERALASAMEAGNIQMTPSVRMFIAQEHDALGHLREALSQARVCVIEATAQTSINNRTWILDRCREVARGVESRVGFVVVRPPRAPIARLTVRLGDTALGTDDFGQELPVLVGRVTLHAEAPGHADLRREITLTVGERRTLDLALEAAGSSAPDVPTPGFVARRGPGPWPWVLLGLGGAGLATSAATYFGPYSTGETNCMGARAPCTSVDRNAIKVFGGASLVSFGLGVAFAASGALWALVFALDRSSPAASTWNVTMSPLAGGGIFMLGREL